MTSEGFLFADFYGRYTALFPCCVPCSIRHFRAPAVVGYLGSDFGDTATVPKGASFITIATTDADGDPCVRLCDLKVTGYEPGTFAWGEARITEFYNDGRNKKCTDGYTDLEYFWIDDGDNGNQGYPAGWYDPMGVPMIEGNDNISGDATKITFKPGQGICFTVQDGYDTWQLQSTGEVLQAPVEKPFGDTATVFVANPLARKITLSEITVTGYEPGTFAWGEARVTEFYNDGRNKKCTDGYTDLEYFWIDDGDDGNQGYPAGWYDPMGMPMIEGNDNIAGDATKIEYMPGQGFYFTIQDGYDTWNVKFPALAPQAK